MNFLCLFSPLVDRGVGQKSAPQKGELHSIIIFTMIQRSLHHSMFVSLLTSPPLFVCSTSIRVVLDCRASTRCSLWLRGASQTVSRAPVETRIGEDMGERDTERIARKDGTAFSVFFKKYSEAVNESVEDY